MRATASVTPCAVRLPAKQYAETTQDVPAVCLSSLCTEHGVDFCVHLVFLANEIMHEKIKNSHSAQIVPKCMSIAWEQTCVFLQQK